MAFHGNERPSLCFTDNNRNVRSRTDSSSFLAGSSTREQRFWQAHHNERSSPEEIQKQMRQINLGKDKCKPKNTIIHDPREKIKDICTNPNSKNVPCNNGRDNCYEGSKLYQVTVCQEKPDSQPDNCRYKCTKEEPVKVTLACERGKPVHLDSTKKAIIHDEL